MWVLQVSTDFSWLGCPSLVKRGNAGILRAELWLSCVFLRRIARRIATLDEAFGEDAGRIGAFMRFHAGEIYMSL